ncbi:MAG: TadG family pilus assembly protein [Thermodesulfobacteriota bacterium]
MILLTIALFSLIGIAALTIDIGHLFVVRSELKNAADAGALAGARSLYLDDGTAVNADANRVAYDASVANRSDQLAVEVNWTGGNGGDVERGHWSFAAGTFTPSSSLAPVDLWNVTAAGLDANMDFINAVRVRTRREATPAASFLARIFGFRNFGMSAESVAYIGFAGALEPNAVDQPFAICKQSLLVNDRYECTVGRMMNDNEQTGGWTNFTQEYCSTASASSVDPLICGTGNNTPIYLGQPMGMTNGTQTSNFNGLRNCWAPGGRLPVSRWQVTLPVIDCTTKPQGGCVNPVIGAVEVNVLYISSSSNDPHFKDVPVQMENWSCSPPGEACWNSFVQHFNLRKTNGQLATAANGGYTQKTIYFLPDCAPHSRVGKTGGENFGILAKIPVLVR